MKKFYKVFSRACVRPKEKYIVEATEEDMKAGIWETSNIIRMVQNVILKIGTMKNFLKNKKETVKSLPNFDSEKFCKCVGIYHI